MEYTLNTSIAEDTSTIQKAIEQIADNEAADSKADGHGQLPENPSRETGVPVSSGQKASVHHWFFTFMWINIPVIGWFYLFYLAFNKSVSAIQADFPDYRYHHTRHSDSHRNGTSGSAPCLYGDVVGTQSSYTFIPPETPGSKKRVSLTDTLFLHSETPDHSLTTP